MTPDAALILPRIVGVFYLLSGFAGLHVMAMDSLMDKMLAALTLKPTPRAEQIRRRLLVSGSFTVGVSGASLMVLSLWAVPLFFIASALQVTWLVWARTGYPVADEADARGRSQTFNAALIFGVMTMLVIALAATDRLYPWSNPWALFIPVSGVALGLFAARHMIWKAKSPASYDFDDEPRDIPPAPQRVRLAPDWGGYPLRDADTNDGVIYDDYLPHELGDRLYQWSRAFHAGDDYEVKEFWAEFADAREEIAHRAEGRAIVAELRTVFEDAEGPVYPADIRYVAGDPKAPGT